MRLPADCGAVGEPLAHVELGIDPTSGLLDYCTSPTIKRIGMFPRDTK